ncbi:hypothetical protein F5883DRAFT_677614 [Diaporthe sp. PMI_573]|nr:hypothetical protein F5883DRAFT_677614 [Diaporthaceae sp. PMI_573]
MHVDSDDWIGVAQREVIGKIMQSVMWKQTIVGPDGRPRPVSAEVYIQHMLRRMWFFCCHDQCGIAFKDVPPIPIKLMEVDGDAEGLWAPEHVRDIRSKEKKEQYEKERVERARRAEEEKAKTLSPCGPEERRRRDIQELSAAHHKDKKDLKTQALLEIQKRKYTIGQRQEVANLDTVYESGVKATRYKVPNTSHSLERHTLRHMESKSEA